MLEVGRSCSNFVHVKNSIYLQTRSLNWLWLKWTNSSFAFFHSIFFNSNDFSCWKLRRDYRLPKYLCKIPHNCREWTETFIVVSCEILYGQKYLVSNKGFFIYTLALKADVYECVQEWFWVFGGFFLWLLLFLQEEFVLTFIHGVLGVLSVD